MSEGKPQTPANHFVHNQLPINFMKKHSSIFNKPKKNLETVRESQGC